MESISSENLPIVLHTLNQIELAIDRLQERTQSVRTVDDFLSTPGGMEKLNKIEAFAASKMHNKTHSIQLVMITTMGVARGEHASIVNQSVVLDNLFADRFL